MVSGVALHDDARCETQAPVLETPVKVGSFVVGDKKGPEGVNFPHHEPIRNDGNRFTQEDHSQEAIDETPIPRIEVQGLISSLYGHDVSDNVVR